MVWVFTCNFNKIYFCKLLNSTSKIQLFVTIWKASSNPTFGDLYLCLKDLCAQLLKKAENGKLGLICPAPATYSHLTLVAPSCDAFTIVKMWLWWSFGELTLILFINQGCYRYIVLLVDNLEWYQRNVCYVIATFTYFSCNPGNKKPFSSPITESILCVYIMFSLPQQGFLCNFTREAQESLITTFVSLLLLIASHCLQLRDTKWTRRKGVLLSSYLLCTPTSSPRAAPPSVSGRGRRSSEQWLSLW